jgi:FkbM family methyltransferase
MLVIDVGANIGTHTVELSKMAGFVLAFEPQRIAFQTLCANLALNHCRNVRAFNAALGRENGHILVPSRDPTKINNFGGVPLAGVTEGEPVDLMKLDCIQFNKCDFIKVDIEGMEAEFLEGAKETIARHRPILYLEADGAQKTEAIRTLFEWKYDCYWDFPRLYNPKNFRGDQENIFIVDGGGEMLSVNVLCVPSERNVRVELRKVLLPRRGRHATRERTHHETAKGGGACLILHWR